MTLFSYDTAIELCFVVSVIVFTRWCAWCSNSMFFSDSWFHISELFLLLQIFSCWCHLNSLFVENGICLFLSRLQTGEVDMKTVVLISACTNGCRYQLLNTDVYASNFDLLSHVSRRNPL